MTAVEHERWGPNGLAVEQVVRRAQNLTADEVRRLASAWDAWTAPDPADGPLDFGDSEPWQVASDEWNDAEEALDEVVAAAGRDVSATAAARAGWDAVPVGSETRRAAANAVCLAALVVAVVDLIGLGEFTADHLELLAGPWRSVVGDLGEPVCECVEVR